MSTNNSNTQPVNSNPRESLPAAASSSTAIPNRPSPSDLHVAEAASILAGGQRHQHHLPISHPSHPPPSSLLLPLQLGYSHWSVPAPPSLSYAGLLPPHVIASGSQVFPPTSTRPTLPIPEMPNVTAGMIDNQMNINSIALAIRAREASLVSARAQLQAQIARTQLEDLTAIISSSTTRTDETIEQQQQQPPTRQEAPAALSSSKEEEDTSPCATTATKSKKSKKKKSSKKKAYPDDAPRRPLSAYNYFFVDERENIIQQRLEEAGTLQEESAAAGTSNATGGGKICKDGYDIEISQMVREMLERQKLPPNEGRRRPHRKRHGIVSFQELAKTIASRWRSLPADQVQYYRKIANIDLQRYRARMFDYNQTKWRGEESSPLPVARKGGVPKAA